MNARKHCPLESRKSKGEAGDGFRWGEGGGGAGGEGGLNPPPPTVPMCSLQHEGGDRGTTNNTWVSRGYKPRGNYLVSTTSLTAIMH